MNDTTSNTLTVDVPAGASFLTITREFDAPPEAVFRAMTDPELIPQWWGPSRYATEVVRLEPQSGGSWRFVQRGDDGEFGFHGVFHEVLPAERVIQTFEFEPMPGHVILETLVFEDLGGRTRISGRSAYQSVEDRDGMVGAGMEAGLSEGYDRLDGLLGESRGDLPLAKQTCCDPPTPRGCFHSGRPLPVLRKLRDEREQARGSES